MKSYFAYIRVSTTRQGVEGVSLQEQRSAILEFASRRGITITEWFEEQVTAAKRGRPIFSKVVSALKMRRAGGLIIHKIDRGARNLRDWADIADLMDRGIEVHFVHESIDLHSRSGRLSADILAVVASDYIRNLREETIKGINGRLRQGLFPFAAPLGYLNTGKGKVKTVDPARAPLIREAFELYASQEYSLQKLEDEMFKRGLRNRKGRIIRLNQLATILRNPFYMGLIRFQGRKETHAGIHTPIITSTLYNKVQFVLDRKRSNFRQPHNHTFSALIHCDNCRRYLVGETKKGHTYYRCHQRRICPKTTIREDRLVTAIIGHLKHLNISPDEEPIIERALFDFKQYETEVRSKVRNDIEAELSYIETSIKTLLQKFLDGAIPKETFDDGNTALLMQRKGCEEKLRKTTTDYMLFAQTEAFINELRSICGRFASAAKTETRQIIERVFTSITMNGSDVINFSLNSFMKEIAGREKTADGWKKLLPVIYGNMA